MSLNLVSPTAFTTGLLVTNTVQTVGGSSDSIPNLTKVDGTSVSAALEIQSNDAGLLIPRLTTDEMDKVKTPYPGMIIYNTTANKIYFYSATGWGPIGNITVSNPPTVIDNIATWGDTTGSILKDSGVNINRVPPQPFYSNFISENIDAIYLKMSNLDAISFSAFEVTLDIDDHVFSYFVRDPNIQETRTIFTDSTFDPTSISPSVLFELNSTRATFLNARMSSGQIDNLLMEPGMQVFDTTNDEFLFFQKGMWTPIGSIVGGAPVDATYILKEVNPFLTNAQSLGSLTTGLLKNTVDETTHKGELSTAVPVAPATNIGDYYGPGFPTTILDTAGIGELYNVFIGWTQNAVDNRVSATGKLNTGLGSGAVESITSGSSNTGLGSGALKALTSGSSNTAVGSEALIQVTDGGENTAVGSAALNKLTIGKQNTGIGQDALNFCLASNNNTAVGQGALQYFEGGTITIGPITVQAGDNTAIGNAAGNAKAVLMKCTFLGAGANSSASLTHILTNSTAVGAGAKVKTDDSISLGDKCFIGILTDSPTYALQVGDSSLTDSDKKPVISLQQVLLPEGLTPPITSALLYSSLTELVGVEEPGIDLYCYTRDIQMNLTSPTPSFITLADNPENSIKTPNSVSLKTVSAGTSGYVFFNYDDVDPSITINSSTNANLSYVLLNDTGIVNPPLDPPYQILDKLIIGDPVARILKLGDTEIELATPDVDYITLEYFQESQGTQDGLIADLKLNLEDPFNFQTTLGDTAIAAGVAATGAALLAADAKLDAHDANDKADSALHKLDEPDIYGSELHTKVVNAQNTADTAKTKAEDAQTAANTAQTDVNELEGFVQLEADQGLILKTYDSILNIPGAQYLNFLPLINTSDPVTNTAGYIYSDGNGNIFKDPGVVSGGAPSGAPYVVTTTYAGLTGPIQTLDTLGGPGGLYCAAAGTLSVANPTFITQSEDLVHVPGAQSLGTLSTGILKNIVTTGTGVLSTAVAGFDYYAPGFPTYLHDTSGSTNNLFVGTNLEGFPNLGVDNVILGLNVSPASIDYSRCIGIGIDILLQNEGADNIAIGYQALTLNGAGTPNIAIGTQAQANNLQGNNNVALGYRALYLNSTGDSNVAIGTNTLLNSSSVSNNIAIGYSALFSNETGTPNIAIGTNTLVNNRLGSDNIAIGYQALTLNEEGSNSIGIGTNTLESNIGGFNNIAIGSQALSGNVNELTGFSSNNIAIGIEAFLATQDSAIDNIVIGNQALGALVAPFSAQKNVIIGNQAVNTSIPGVVESTFIGYNTQSSVSVLNSTVIGANAVVELSSSVILGNGCNVGIGTSSPTYTVYIGNVNSPLLAAAPAASLFLEETTNVPTFTAGGGVIYVDGNDLYFDSTGTPINLTTGGGTGGGAPLNANYVLGSLPSPNPFTGVTQDLSALPNNCMLKDVVSGGRGTITPAVPVPQASLIGDYYAPGFPTIIFDSTLTTINSLAGNLFIGMTDNDNATKYNDGGGLNCGIGLGTLDLLTSGISNTAVGALSSLSISTGMNNTSVGAFSLNQAESSGTTAIGYQAANNQLNYTSCTFLGELADASVNNLTNATAIGANATVATSNSLVLGSGANVGIGTSSPEATLHITGTQGLLYNLFPSFTSTSLVVNASSVQATGQTFSNLFSILLPTSGQTVINLVMQLSGLDAVNKFGYGGMGILSVLYDASNNSLTLVNKNFLANGNYTGISDPWNGSVSYNSDGTNLNITVRGISSISNNFTVDWFCYYQYYFLTI